MSRYIGIVPLRSGSKGIPNKNIKDFLGKPLFWWVCNALQKSHYIEEFHVLLDSMNYADAFVSFYFSKGRIHWRSIETATDEATTESAVMDWIHKGVFKREPEDHIVLVQATSPWVNSFFVDGAISQYVEETDCKSLLSVSQSERFFWTYKSRIEQVGVPVNYDPIKRERRQNFHNGLFVENGGIYINSIQNYIDNKCRLTPPVSLYITPPYTSYEIDEKEDWNILETLLQEKGYATNQS